MKNKIGANDLCPCGSGGKYKKCCFSSINVSARLKAMDPEWRKLRQLEGEVFDNHLIPYAMNELPSSITTLAMLDFFPNDLPNELDKELVFNTFFIPWFLFNWLPYEELGLEDFDQELTIAQNYLMTYEEDIDEEVTRFIDAMDQTYYSFYAVLQIELNKSLLVKDIFLGTTHEIKEQLGTHQLKPGDVIFSRILTHNNQSIFVGMAPFILLASYHYKILDFKELLIDANKAKALTPDLLNDVLDPFLLDYFFKLVKDMFNTPPPTLANTDDELIKFSRSHFKLNMSPQEALKRLLPLTLSDDEEEFLKDAKRTKSGEIKRLEFPWLKKGNQKHKSWDNTVLGHISIEKGELILETNSEERNQKGKKLFEKYLGEAISFQKTHIESTEEKLAFMSNSTHLDDAESNRLMALPEVRDQIQAMAQTHWENWFDEDIPALGGISPRKAAKTAKGRERLEALLLEYEREILEIENTPFKADVDYLRKKLGLN